MANLNTSDIVFATVRQHGNTIANIRLSGMSSVSQILNYIKRFFRDTVGLLSVNLRNGTQGWSQTLNIIMRPSVQRPVQLSLFD